MPHIPVPESSLSQVVFVHDYMQLVFQEEILTIYNTARLTVAGVQYVQGGDGFADKVVRLIESKVIAVSEERDRSLDLRFEGEEHVSVLVGQAGANGPEAYMFCGLNGLVVVELNP